MAGLPQLSCVVTGTLGFTHDKLFTFRAEHPLAKWLGDVLDMRPAGPLQAAPPGGGPGGRFLSHPNRIPALQRARVAEPDSSDEEEERLLASGQAGK